MKLIKTNWKLALVLLLLSFIGTAAALPYLLYTTVLPSELNITPANLAVITFINFTINSIIAIMVGIAFSRKAGLDAPLLRKWLYQTSGTVMTAKSLLFAVIVGIIGILLTIGADLLFQPYLPDLLKQNTSGDLVPVWAGLLTMFQGGIVEELWLRFGLMTFVVWLLSRIFTSKQQVIPTWIYITAIIIAALMFGVGHLGAASLMYAEVTRMLVVRIIIVNSIAGLFYGYLYWKKGLEHAIVAHMIGDIILHAIIA